MSKEHWIDCIPELSGCVGKTIAGCDRDGEYVVIRFADGNCLALRSETDGLDDGCWALPQRRINIAIDTARRAAKGAGVITDAIFKKISEENQRRYSERRREQYEELKREFERGTTNR